MLHVIITSNEIVGNIYRDNQGGAPLATCKSIKWFRRCGDIVKHLDTLGSAEQAHTRGIGSWHHKQSVPNACSKQWVDCSYYFGKQLHTERRSWSSCDHLSNLFHWNDCLINHNKLSNQSRFKEGWCGLSPVSDVVCNQPFTIEIIQSSKAYGKSGAAKPPQPCYFQRPWATV